MSEEHQSVEIHPDSLSPEALQGVLHDFILREGTDYGHEDWTLEEKELQVRKALKLGEAQIMYDVKAESCTIIHR